MMQPLPLTIKILTLLLIFMAVLLQHQSIAGQDTSDQADSQLPIVLAPLVTFAKESEISVSIKKECGLSEALVTSIQKYSSEYSVPLIVGAQNTIPSSDVAKVLTAEITEARQGVYAFIYWHTKPAVLNVHYKVTDGKDTVIDISHNCSSRLSGFEGLDSRVCTRVSHCVDEQARYISKLIKKKLYRAP